jgi:hypothetical protein
MNMKISAKIMASAIIEIIMASGGESVMSAISGEIISQLSGENEMKAIEENQPSMAK